MKRHPVSPSQRSGLLEGSNAEVSLEVEDAPFGYGDVRSAIAGLPRELQEVLLLYWLRGLDDADIARELNLPLPRIRSRIARAKAMLRATIGSGRFAD